MGLLDRVSFAKGSTAPPESIELNDRDQVVIRWPGGPEVAIPSFNLRDQCPCAACIEEGTGKKILDAGSIPPDVRPLEIKPVGNYAIQISWSDGHGSGIYTWQTLRRASGLDAG